MNWKIKYKKDAWKFLTENELVEKFEETIKSFIKEGARIDIKKLRGKLHGHHRLRIGKTRVIYTPHVPIMDRWKRVIKLRIKDLAGRI